MILYFYKNTKYVEIRILLKDVRDGEQTEKTKGGYMAQKCLCFGKVNMV